MSRALPARVLASPAPRQLVPLRPGEPLWPGSGYQIWEEALDGNRTLVGFVPEPALSEVIGDYARRGITVEVAGQEPQAHAC